MKRKIFLIALLSVFCFAGFSQYKITGEFQILNSTKSKTGAYLQNIGNGVTTFNNAIDSVYASGDSLVFRYGTQLVKFPFFAGASGGLSFTYPLSQQGTVVSISGWNKLQWDSAYNWYKSNPLANYVTQNQFTGYHNANWDLAYSWGNHALAGYLTKAQADSLYGISAGSLEYTNGMERTGNKVFALTDNALWNARKLQGYWIDPVEPLDGQAPIFHSDTKSYIPGFFDGSGVNGGGADGNYYLDNVTLNNGHMIFSRVTLSPLDVALFDSLDQRYITLPQLNDSLDAILPIVMDGKFFKGEGTDAIPVTLRDDLFPPAPVEFTATAATSSVQLLGASNYLVEVIRGALAQSNSDKGDGFYYTKLIGSETLTFYPALKAGEFVHLSFTNPNLSSPITKQ